jgi:hypothetical protein
MSIGTRLVAWGAAIALGMPSVAGAATVTIPHRDFASPEAAVSAFAHALAANDPGRALATFAIDREAQGFDFDRYVNRLQTIDLQTPIPSDTPLGRELGRLELAGRAADQVKNAWYSLLSSKPNENGPLIVAGPSQTTAFHAAIRPGKLAGLRIAQIASVPAGLEKNPDYQRTLQSEAQAWGADEVTARAVLYRLGARTYMGGAMLIRYGRSWGIQTLSAPIFDTPGSGRLQPTSAAAFRAKVNVGG